VEAIDWSYPGSGDKSGLEISRSAQQFPTASTDTPEVILRRKHLHFGGNSVESILSFEFQKKELDYFI